MTESDTLTVRITDGDRHTIEKTYTSDDVDSISASDPNILEVSGLTVKNLQYFTETQTLTLTLKNGMTGGIGVVCSSLQESETLINSLALSSPSVEEEINALDLQSFIDRVYLSLPEKVVNTFRMSRQDGFTYNEIAEKLGITVKVVEYHISITLKALRLKLGSSYNNNAVQTVR